MEKNSLIIYAGDVPVLRTDIELAIVRSKYMADDATAKYKNIMAELKEEMDRRGIVRIETDKLILTITNPSDREVFDTKRFRQDYPDLYAEYCEMKPQTPTLKPTFRSKNEQE